MSVALCSHGQRAAVLPGDPSSTCRISIFMCLDLAAKLPGRRVGWPRPNSIMKQALVQG